MWSLMPFLREQLNCWIWSIWRAVFQLYGKFDGKGQGREVQGAHAEEQSQQQYIVLVWSMQTL
jgi:hypothetical protein